MDQAGSSGSSELDCDLAALADAIRRQEPAGDEEFRRVVTPMIRIVLNRAQKNQSADQAITPESLCEEMIRQLHVMAPDARAETLRWIRHTVSLP